MRLDPLNRDTYLFEQGEAYTELGQRKAAISAIKRTLVHHSDTVFDHWLLGIDYSFLGDEDDAQAEAAVAERTIGGSPSANGYLVLADLLNIMGKPAEALVAVDK